MKEIEEWTKSDTCAQENQSGHSETACKGKEDKACIHF